MSAPWDRPTVEAGYATLPPTQRERLTAQRAEAAARRMREAFVGAAQHRARMTVAAGRDLAHVIVTGSAR